MGASTALLSAAAAIVESNTAISANHPASSSRGEISFRSKPVDKDTRTSPNGLLPRLKGSLYS